MALSELYKCFSFNIIGISVLAQVDSIRVEMMFSIVRLNSIIWGEPEQAPYKSIGGCTHVRPYIRRLRTSLHVQKFTLQQLAVAMANSEGKRTAV